MKVEFHYYITHLIAARAGLRGDDLRILTYASQFTDDNHIAYKIKKGRKIVYENRISQTMRPIKRHAARLEVYPLFHFIPGDPNAESARRNDKKQDCMNTTPNSANANLVLDEALKSGDFYQIGIAIHAFVDTWAHQNFVGFKSAFNKFSGFVDKIIPNIGHADAKTKPDQPRLIWEDERLVNKAVDNKERFLDAAGFLFDKLRMFVDSSCSEENKKTDRDKLVADLSQTIGDNPKEVNPSKERLEGYSNLAMTSEYGCEPIVKYRPGLWFDAAVRKIKVMKSPAPRSQRSNDVIFNFKTGYEESDWFKFQQAVKIYAERTKKIICETPEILSQYSG